MCLCSRTLSTRASLVTSQIGLTIRDKRRTGIDGPFGRSQGHEPFDRNAYLADDGADGRLPDRLAFVPGHGNNSAVGIPHPQFVRSLPLTVEAKAESSEPLNDFAIIQLAKWSHPASPIGTATVIRVSGVISTSLNPSDSPRSAR